MASVQVPWCDVGHREQRAAVGGEFLPAALPPAAAQEVLQEARAPGQGPVNCCDATAYISVVTSKAICCACAAVVWRTLCASLRQDPALVLKCAEGQAKWLPAESCCESRTEVGWIETWGLLHVPYMRETEVLH